MRLIFFDSGTVTTYFGLAADDSVTAHSHSYSFYMLEQRFF